MDDSEIKDLLEENLKLSKENNRMLNKLRSAQRFSSAMRAIYWLILIGISVGAFYYIQPYFDQVKSLYSEAGTNYNQLKDLKDKFPNFFNGTTEQK